MGGRKTIRESQAATDAAASSTPGEAVSEEAKSETTVGFTLRRVELISGRSIKERMGNIRIRNWMFSEFLFWTYNCKSASSDLVPDSSGSFTPGIRDPVFLTAYYWDSAGINLLFDRFGATLNLESMATIGALLRMHNQACEIWTDFQAPKSNRIDLAIYIPLSPRNSHAMNDYARERKVDLADFVLYSFAEQIPPICRSSKPTWDTALFECASCD